MDARRHWRLPALFFACLALWVVAPALRGPAGAVLGAQDGDLTYQHLPWRAFGFGELAQGRLALWNPHIFGGAPFFGGFQSALLYPPNWIQLVTTLAVGVNAYLWIQLFLAGFFTFLWCRKRGNGAAASTLAGLVFLLSGPFLFHVEAGHLPQIGSMAWAPAIFLAVDGWSEAGGEGWILFAMAAAALQIFAGSPQHVYYTAFGAGLYALARPRRLWKRSLLGLAAAYLGASLLAAVQLWTGLAAAWECVRGAGAGRAFAGSFSLPPENLLTLAAPFVFGDDRTIPYIGRTYLWESCLFVGAAVLTLAAIGLARGRRRLGLWAVLGSVFVLALGAHTPLFGLCYRLLPGYGYLRGTVKFGWLAALIVAAAAAAGFDALGLRPPPPRWAAVAAGLAALLFLSAGVLRLPVGLETFWRPLMALIAASKESPISPKVYQEAVLTGLTALFASRALLKAGWVFLACAGLLWLGRRRRAARWGLALLALLELTAFARSILTTASTAEDLAPVWSEALQAGNAERRVLDPGRTSADAGMRVGLDGVWGYDPFVLHRYAEFIAASQGLDPKDSSQYVRFTKTPPVYRLLRVGADAMPRVSLVGGARVVPDKDQLLKTLLSPGFDPANTVLLQTPPQPAPSPAARGTVHAIGSVPGRLDLEVELDAPALLLITDAYSEGWRAMALDAGPQAAYEVLPADLALQAVPLSAGRHRLRLEYAPAAFRLGSAVSLLSWVALTNLSFLLYFRGETAG